MVEEVMQAVEEPEQRPRANISPRREAAKTPRRCAGTMAIIGAHPVVNLEPLVG